MGQRQDSEADDNRKWVVLGKVGRTHGLQGWVRLHSFTDPPENLVSYQQFRIELQDQAQELQVDQVRQADGQLIVLFKGFDTPESARVLAGRELQVDSRELPGLPPGEYYRHQLEGLLVANTAGQRLGRVARVLETGANDVLVVKPDADSIDGRERLIPYLRDRVIRKVDLQRALIEVDWEADYLA